MPRPPGWTLFLNRITPPPTHYIDLFSLYPGSSLQASGLVAAPVAIAIGSSSFRDGSVDKGACCKSDKREPKLQNPYGGGRNALCPLVHMSCDTHVSMHKHTHTTCAHVQTLSHAHIHYSKNFKSYKHA